jgi:hypothetical protein
MASLRTPWLLPLTVAIALGLVTGACSQDDAEGHDESDVVAVEIINAVAGAKAEEVIDPVDETDSAVDLPPGCVVVTEEDEYGFPIDVMRCGDEAPPPPEPGTDLRFVEWLRTDEADQLAVALRDVLVLQTACGDGSAIRELQRLVAGVPGQVAEPLEKATAELGQASLFCNVDATAWQDHLDLAIAHLQVFVQAAEKARSAPAASADGDEVDNG